MLPKNKLVTFLKCKSGASLIFVLGIMLMLFAMGGAVIAGTNSQVDIGSSVTGAASANFGSNIRQNQYNAAVVLSESIHRCIRESLLTPTSAPGFNTSLAYALPTAMLDIFKADKAGSLVKATEFNKGLSLTLNSSNLGDSLPPPADYSIKIAFPLSSSNPSFVEHAPIPAMPELGFPREPASVTISATVVIEVKVNLQGAGNRSLTTLATYQYRDGLADDNVSYDDENPEVPGDLDFPDNSAYGVWKLVSYEMTESG